MINLLAYQIDNADSTISLFREPQYAFGPLSADWNLGASTIKYLAPYPKWMLIASSNFLGVKNVGIPMFDSARRAPKWESSLHTSPPISTWRI